MVKCRTIGGIQASKVNPVLTAEKDLANYSFVVGKDGITYLVINEISGDDSYKDGIIIPKGEFLNGYEVAAWDGLELEIDAKHIQGGIDSFNYDGNDILVVDADKNDLKAGEKTELHLIVTGKCFLTEKAVTARVCLPEAAGE